MNNKKAQNYIIREMKGMPVLGMLIPALRNPLAFIMDLSRDHGDIVSFHIAGQKTILVNHPDLINYVLTKNNKNYKKNKYYVRFESAIGQGLLISNGEKWKRDRQKIQPFFDKNLIATYHFEIVNSVGEKYKQKWLAQTASGSAEIDITAEMARITTEIILKSIFGKDIDQETVSSLHHSYESLVEYLKNLRVIYNVDMRKIFHMPAYSRFKRELDNIDSRLNEMIRQHRNEGTQGRQNMLSLLIEAQKHDPVNFSDQDIRDHCVSMVFAGFETTSILMQWMWYLLDENPDAVDKLRREITAAAPCTAQQDSSALVFEEIGSMEYLTAVIKETMRLYPPFWLGGREAIEDDELGDFKVRSGTALAISQFAMHRNSQWWSNPDAFEPERFLGDNESKIAEGAYFPFSLGPRKCSGYVFAMMEAKTLMTKFIPLFNVKAVNKAGNAIYPSASLKLKYPLRAVITRI